MPASTPDMELPEADGLLSDLQDETRRAEEVEPIAIIGLSITFPQNMTTLDLLWENLAERKSAMTEFPKSRLNLDAFYDPDTERVNGVRFLSGSSSSA
jgi:acyl transferase domain-containing protein